MRPPANTVQAFKYGDRLDLAPAMGRWMALAGRELLTGADALVPVPLHWTRLWARRFNQAATLAKTISRQSGVPITYNTLKRVRATRQQVGLTQVERAPTSRARSGCPMKVEARCAGGASCSSTMS